MTIDTGSIWIYNQTGRQAEVLRQTFKHTTCEVGTAYYTYLVMRCDDEVYHTTPEQLNRNATKVSNKDTP